MSIGNLSGKYLVYREYIVNTSYTIVNYTLNPAFYNQKQDLRYIAEMEQPQK